MADNGSYTNTGKSRFGYRFGSWDTLTETRTNPWAKSDPPRDHVCRPVAIGSDGKAMPGVVDYPSKNNHKGTMTMVEESTYLVQSINQYEKDNVPGNRKMGFPSGMFQRMKSEPALISNDGWTRPNPKGWNLPPKEPLEKEINNSDSGYARGSAQPNSGSGWIGPSPKGRLEKVTNDIDRAAEYVSGPAGPTLPAGGRRWGSTGVATIDSRETVKRYDEQ